MEEKRGLVRIRGERYGFLINLDSDELWSRDMGVEREEIERIEKRYLR